MATLKAPVVKLLEDEPVRRSKRSRQFNIMQYVAHPTTGAPLLDEGRIKQALGRKSIKHWAYILHDKDKTQDGAPKPPHWHIVIQCPDSPQSVDTVAAWFDIQSNFVDVPRGKTAWRDCLVYLDHRAAPDKHRYDVSEIRTNIEDFNGYLNDLTLAYDRSARLDGWLSGLVEGTITLEECRTADSVLYGRNVTKLRACDADRRARYRSPVSYRRNYLITGESGAGKSTMAYALARELYPDIKRDEDVYYVVGDRNVMFQGYTGQPVVIWDDVRPVEFVQSLGRGATFELFDPYPKGGKAYNVKYGHVYLRNEVNIITTILDGKSFLRQLAGEYTDRYGYLNLAEDVNQAYRRMQCLITVLIDGYDLYWNTASAAQIIGLPNIVAQSDPDFPFVHIGSYSANPAQYRRQLITHGLTPAQVSDVCKAGGYERRMLEPVLRASAVAAKVAEFNRLTVEDIARNVYEEMMQGRSDAADVVDTEILSPDADTFDPSLFASCGAVGGS